MRIQQGSRTVESECTIRSPQRELLAAGRLGRDGGLGGMKSHCRKELVGGLVGGLRGRLWLGREGRRLGRCWVEKMAAGRGTGDVWNGRGLLGADFGAEGCLRSCLKTGWKLIYHQQTWFRNYISQSISYVHEARTIQSTPNYARYPSRRVS